MINWGKTIYQRRYSVKQVRANWSHRSQAWLRAAKAWPESVSQGWAQI